MKNIIEFINEKLKIRKSKHEYIYFPTSCEELQDIIFDKMKNIKGKEREIYVGDIDISKVDSLRGCFSYSDLQYINGLEYWDVSRFKNLSDIFGHCKNLVSLDLTGWDVSHTENFIGTFQFCDNLETIEGIEDWDMSSAKNVNDMFGKCPKLNIDISNWKLPDNCIRVGLKFESPNVIY